MIVRLGSRQVRLGRVAIWLLALLLALISAAPILWVVMTAFKSFVQSQARPPIWIPDFGYVKNFVDQFGVDGKAIRPLQNSLIVATVSMVVTMALAIPAAYALARYVIRRKPESTDTIIIDVKVSDAKRSDQANVLLAPGDVVSVESTPATMFIDSLRMMNLGLGATLPLTALF